MLSSSSALKRVFHCPEESNFYSHCLENLIFSEDSVAKTVIEFGSGDGSPVIKSLLRTNFEGTIYGFELNYLAAKIAQSQIQEHNLNSQYSVQSSCFFTATRPPAEYLISNPPYLPAADDRLYQPLLHGGRDGSKIAKQLLLLGYENVLLMVSSYSHPEGLLDVARKCGYAVSNFLVAPLSFGFYSSEPKVQEMIASLRKQGRAFYTNNIYLLAGVLFKKQDLVTTDLSRELSQIMTSL